MPSWKKIIVSGSDAELNQLTATSFGGNISGSSTSTGSFAVYGNDFLPSEDNTHDLGSSAKEWKDLYLDGVAYIDRADIGNIDIAPSGLNDTIRRPSGNLFLQFGAGASSKLFIGNESGVVIDDTTVSGSSSSTGSFGRVSTTTGIVGAGGVSQTARTNADDLVINNSTSDGVGISILGSDSFFKSINFGGADSDRDAVISYSGTSANKMTIGTTRASGIINFITGNGDVSLTLSGGANGVISGSSTSTVS